MLPIRDIQVRGHRPWSLYLLILVIIGVFVGQVRLGYEVSDFVGTWGLIPRRFWTSWSKPEYPDTLRNGLTVVTATFLHSGYLHLLGNLLYLKVFGERVAGCLGGFGFLGVYILAGICGGIVHLWVYATDPVPMIGASGAIAGILGVYVVLFPSARVTTLFPVIFVLTFVELPAVIFVGIWAAQQALNGYMQLAGGLGAREVAWMAHLGGFVFGLVLGGGLRARGYNMRPISDEPLSLH